MKDDKSIVISIRFRGDLNQEETILFYSELFRNNYNKLFSELHYTITDKSKYNWSQKTKGGKLTDKSFSKFKNVIAIANEKTIVDFELLTNLQDCEYKSRDIDISITYNQLSDIKSLNFILFSGWANEINFIDFIKISDNLLKNQNCNLLSGYAMELENSKMPSFYIQGIKTEGLNSVEEHRLLTWSAYNQHCDSKFWNVFWGNIISKGHLNNKFSLIEDVIKIVGEENVVKLSNDVFWFNINSTISNSNSDIYLSQKKMLTDLFKKNNLLAI